MSHELMAAIAFGSREESDAAFARLVDMWQRPLQGYVFRLLRSWPDSEDCVQSVLLTVWTHAAIYREANFAGWICTIARRRALDVIRRRNRDPLRSVEPDDPDGSDPLDEICVDTNSTLGAMIDREDLDAISLAMESVPHDQRATLELYVSGYSLPEIADASGVPVPTAKSRNRLAREKILEALSEPI